jgi:DNA-binding XRE family transcriptional regulator
MDKDKKERLEAAGWKVGDFADFCDFLGLDDVERQLIEIRVDLGIATRKLREAKGLTQKALAKQIESTQSRVSKIEEADPEVSLDLMFRAFFAIGGKLEDLTSHSTPLPKPEVPAIKPKPKARRLAKQGG